MARSFNGSSDVVTTGNFNTPNTPITISLWAKSSTATTGLQAFIGTRCGAANLGPQFRFDGSGNLQFSRNNVLVIATSSGITLSNSAFKLCAVTYDQVNCIFYYGDASGVQTSTTATNLGLSTNTNGYTIGASCTNNSDVASTQWFSGPLADVAVWNVILTTSEITALCRGARPSRVRPLSLLSWWPLDGLQSPEPDLSGNAHNGTLTGTASALGPPFMPFTPRWPQSIIVGAAAPSTIFRRTLSNLGTRTGSRQVEAI